MNNIWLLLLKSFYDKIINTNEEDSKQFWFVELNAIPVFKNLTN